MYHDFRDFTTDPVRFPADEVRVFIRELVCGVCDCVDVRSLKLVARQEATNTVAHVFVILFGS